MQTLDKRLSLMASYMTPGGKGIDVGTDHGYLAVYLVQSGKASSMIASDIRPGPLSSAEHCVKEAGLEDKIELILTDGLFGIDLNGVTDILIAGMGGILISEILSARETELRNINLILQPMTQASFLRKWLYENGYTILSEKCAVAAGKAYSVINARYTGNSVQLSELEALIGKTMFDESKDTDQYIETLLKRKEKELNGLLKANVSESRDVEQLQILVNQIKQLAEKRKGVSK